MYSILHPTNLGSFFRLPIPSIHLPLAEEHPPEYGGQAPFPGQILARRHPLGVAPAVRAV